MSKHTPGPWEVEFDDSDHSEGHIIRMGEAIGSPGFHKTHHRIQYDHMLYPEDKGFEEAQANALLIAAAPELLEALQGVLETTRDPARGAYHADAIEARRVAVLAIERATGSKSWNAESPTDTAQGALFDMPKPRPPSAIAEGR